MLFPKGLIVSCQAYEGDPLFGAHIMAALARAAEEGGAVGIRANSPADIAAIRQSTKLPIVGLYKVHSTTSEVYITPDLASAVAIAQAGCDMIAIDATPRPRQNGTTLEQLVRFIHDELGKPVMADVSCIEDALLAQTLGVEVISTTMAGYTAHGRPKMPGPDLEFLAEVVKTVSVPVTAEGRFHEPQQVAQAMALGAHAVIVGSAITRPEDITRRFVNQMPEVRSQISDIRHQISDIRHQKSDF